MYTFDSRIRYSEVDSDGNLSLESLLDYFQDCSTFQSEDLGVGFDYLIERNMVWVLSSWQIVVERYPKVCEKVTTGTFPYDFKGCFGKRNFFMKDNEGKYLAKANSLWTLLNMDSFRPARPTEDMLNRYQLEEKLSMDYADRKIAVPEDGTILEPVVIHKQHLDTNHHVNNGQYVRIAMDSLPDEFNIAQMRAEYKKQAHLGDVLYPYLVANQQDDGYTYIVSLRDSEKNVYVNVEFLGK